MRLLRYCKFIPALIRCRRHDLVRNIVPCLAPLPLFIGRTLGAWMQVGDSHADSRRVLRFDSDEISRLYDRRDYQLRRLLGRTKGAVHPAT
jgi:hypothetical protein